VLNTRVCGLFGIEHPVLNAPMGGGDAPAELAAAVANAGGLGLIGGTTIGGVDWLVDQIRRARDLTDRPFGVGVISHLPGAAELMAAALDEGVRIIAHSFADPTPFVGAAHDAGAKVVCQVRSVTEARRAADAGVDAITAQGTEAGGHTGRIATFALVPQVIDAVSPRPVVAAGGIADGRGLAAALALGAIGVWCGTAFLVANEANQPETQKQRVLAAGDEDTKVTRLYSGKTMRNITNPLIEAWEASGLQPLPMGLQGILIGDLVYSLRKAGREDLLMNAAGQASGLLNTVRPAAEILNDMVGMATDILARKLPATTTVTPGN
jgi:nitronate monooxygenase